MDFSNYIILNEGEASESDIKDPILLSKNIQKLMLKLKFITWY